MYISNKVGIYTKRNDSNSGQATRPIDADHQNVPNTAMTMERFYHA